MSGEADKATTLRQHAAWLRECARRTELLAAEYRANADRLDTLADNGQQVTR